MAVCVITNPCFAGNLNAFLLFLGALNTTATTIVVKKQELPPPPKLRDFVNEKITENTVFETNNNFQRDWLTGGYNSSLVLSNS